MHVLICLLLIQQVSKSSQPGPLDAFRANHASIRAEMSFIIEPGTINASSYNNNIIWTGRDIDFTPHANHEQVGDWACDGVSEASFCGSPDAVIIEARKSLQDVKNDYMKIGYFPKSNSLFDGEMLAQHKVNETTDPDGSQYINVWNNSGGLPSTPGPFFFWEHPFPSFLGYRFPSIKPRLTKGVHGGVECDVEVYRKELEGGAAVILEVAYDPNQGYLPRHTRLLSIESGGKAFIRESFLIEAKPCAAGGFVPTEWYSAAFAVERFRSAYSNYDETVKFTPGGGRLTAKRFRANGFRNRTQPAALTHLTGVRGISAPGGLVKLGTSPPRLTLSDIKSRLGRKLTEPVPAPPLPTLDLAEIHQYDQQGQTYRWYWILPIFGVMLAVAFLIRRQSAPKAAIFLILITTSFGCERTITPIVILRAAFEKTTYLHDSPSDGITMELVARNGGNQHIRILKVDGGCSCRKVDQSSLPWLLAPDESCKFTVKYTPGQSSQPQMANFSFETDKGVLIASAPFYPLARYSLAPESPAHLSIDEGEDWTFDLTHRVIYENEDALPAVRIDAPLTLEVVKGGKHQGQITGAPGLAYQDQTYHVRLRDRELGLHKEMVRVLGQNDRILAQSAVIWKRVPFLSSIPERVSLSHRPMRVFLRCADDTIEFTKIRSIPPGVKALITSPREISIQTDGVSKLSFEGMVVVETSASGRDPLSIPVVHYVSESITVTPSMARGNDESPP